MSLKLSAWVAAFMLALVVLVALGGITIHTATPTPAPTPTPTPNALETATGMTAHGALIAWQVAIGVLPFFAMIGVALHGRHRARLLEPLNPPLRDREAVHRIYDVKTLEARRGWLPESFTYSPHVRGPDVIEDDAPIPALQGPMLTAAQAIAMDGIVYGTRLDTGEPLVEQRVLSLAIGGRPGSGKTSTALLLAAQYQRMGADLRVADPHSGHPGSLLTQLQPLVGRSALGWVAETPRETLMLVDQVAEQLEQRKDRWRRHNGSTTPLVLLIDEFAESLRLLPPGDRERLLDKVQVVGYGGRKYGVCCVLLAQSWLAAAIGSSQVRNPLRAAIVHAMRPDEGRALTGLRAEAWPSDPSALEPGEAYVLGVGASGLVRVRVPLLEPRAAYGPADARLTDGMRPAYGEALPSATDQPDVSHDEAGETPSLEDFRVAELFDQGRDIPEIVRQIYAVQSSAGARYQRSSREVQAALRRVRNGGRK